MKRSLALKVLFLIFSLLLLDGCGTKRVAPITGRKYRVHEHLYSDAQMLNIVKSDYPAYVRSLGGDSKNVNETKRVRTVASKLIAAATDYLKNNGYANELKNYEWEVHLVPAPGQINATCMPGGKIVVFEGILPVAQNDAGLAAILGHEIGHAIAHHVAEKFTKKENKTTWQKLGAAGVMIAGVATGGDAQAVNGVIQNTIGLSNQIMEFVEMKYSRNHEYEADHIGMVLMAMAGYDPKEAPKVWERMTQYFGDNDMRILSTHPSNKNRMKKMNEKWMGEALSYYNGAGGKQRAAKMAQNMPVQSSPKTTNSGATGRKYKVTATSLNVRNLPSVSNTKVLGSLARGQVITVLEITNGWAKISYNGKTGYVKCDYIKEI